MASGSHHPAAHLVHTIRPSQDSLEDASPTASALGGERCPKWQFARCNRTAPVLRSACRQPAGWPLQQQEIAPLRGPASRLLCHRLAARFRPGSHSWRLPLGWVLRPAVRRIRWRAAAMVEGWVSRANHVQTLGLAKLGNATGRPHRFCSEWACSLICVGWAFQS